LELTWHGWSCFRLKGKEASVVTDPIGPASASILSKLSPDIVTISQRMAESPAGPFRVIDGPGEYEVKSVLITGHPSFFQGKRVGSIFRMEIDDLVVCHLGQLKEPLTPSQAESLSGVDLLFIPVAGDGESIDATKAVEMITIIEPRMVIPMHFELGQNGVAGTPVEKFCHEIGQSVSVQPRLVVAKSSLPAETSVVLLEPR